MNLTPQPSSLAADFLAAARPAPTFREFVDEVAPWFRWHRYADVLAEALQSVADGELGRLMVFMHPRVGKSLLISRLFPAYYVRRYPSRHVGLASYAAALAYDHSRAARDLYRLGGGDVRRDAGGVEFWQTAQRGGMWAAGVGGPATGRGFSLGVIDDPLKNREEAESETIRERHKGWWKDVWYTRRASSEAALVVVLTRWHEDDLAGWLLEQESDENPQGWAVMQLQALYDPSTRLEVPPSCVLFPDWRNEPGEPLCPERFDAAELQRTKATLGPYSWGALYQGTPKPAEGNSFKRAWFEEVDAAPYDARRVRSWDEAATDDAGDWTAGVLLAEKDGTYYVEDVVRGQWGPGKRDEMIRETALADGPNVTVWGQQEPGASGKDRRLGFIRLLAGFDVHSEPATGSKELRAQGLRAQAQAGLVKIVRGEWNRAFLEEAAAFPMGRHDDQVDAASWGFNRLALGGGTVQIARAAPSPSKPPLEERLRAQAERRMARVAGRSSGGGWGR